MLFQRRLIPILISSLWATAALGGVEDGIYELRINNSAIPDVVVAGGKIVDDRMMQAGIKEGKIDFANCGGCTAHLDDGGEILVIRMPAGYWGVTEYSLAYSRDADFEGETVSRPIFNYVVAGAIANNQTAASANVQAIIPLDKQHWTWISTHSVASSGSGLRANHRFGIEYIDEKSGVRARVGDGFAGNAIAPGGRSMRGVSFRSDRGYFDPKLANPGLKIEGLTENPSTVEIFVNGRATSKTAIRPGEYRISGLPSITATGDVRVVVKDAEGNETAQQFRLPGASGLLRSGYQTWGVDFGKSVDQNPEFMGAAYFRRGINDWITLGGAANYSRDKGVGMFANVSAGLPVGGISATVGNSYIDAGYTLETRYARIRAMHAQKDSDKTTSVVLNGYAGQLSWAVAHAVTQKAGKDQGRTSISANYKAVSVYANRSTADGKKPVSEAGITVNIPFGKVRTSVSSTTRDYRARASYNDSDWGASFERVVNRYSQITSDSFAGYKKMDSVAINARVSRTENAGRRTNEFQVTAAGSVIFDGFRPNFTSDQGNSFFEVETGVKGYVVIADNKHAGKTNAAGKRYLLAPRNHVSSLRVSNPEGLDEGVRQETVNVRGKQYRGTNVSLIDAREDILIASSTQVYANGAPMVKTSRGYWALIDLSKKTLITNDAGERCEITKENGVCLLK